MKYNVIQMTPARTVVGFLSVNGRITCPRQGDPIRDFDTREEAWAAAGQLYARYGMMRAQDQYSWDVQEYDPAA